ncbi:MAG: TIGR04283 family arsenosugar biosynthesis glycosyltransferase [Methylococcales bacterium]
MKLDPLLSIIIPTWNEDSCIDATLTLLQPIRQWSEIIVVDAGSKDSTQDIARPLADLVITSKKGRAVQMNAGVNCANGEYLLFLHADTQMPLATQSALFTVLKKTPVWGRFDIALSEQTIILQIVATSMNWRSRLTGIATGDQGIFVQQPQFTAIGQFPNIALMEDIAISRKLRKVSRPTCITQPLITSSRRWESAGSMATIMLMWRLRLQYFFGTDPEKLAHIYQSHNSKCNAHD